MEIIRGIRVLNLEKEEFHSHTSTFSDGFNSIDGMVIFAGEIGMTKIVFTDHSQACLDIEGFSKRTYRPIIKNWANVHNDVEVIFGVEADILDARGDICSHIQGVESEHVILSAHPHVFSGNKITQAYLNAIERYSDKIMFIGHLCLNYFEKEIDIDPIIDLALEKDVPFELNCANLLHGRTNMPNLRKMLSRARSIYVNSDAHTLNQLRDYRKKGFEFLRSSNW